jgi:hypothetical protein
VSGTASAAGADVDGGVARPQTAMAPNPAIVMATQHAEKN